MSTVGRPIKIVDGGDGGEGVVLINDQILI